MISYTIGDSSNYGNQTVSAGHFGVNLVTIYDQEFVDPSNELSQNVRDLGATTLRFPGGTATEVHFDMTQPNLTVSSRSPDHTVTPMDAFFAEAGRIGVDVTLVIPTQMAFGKSAAEAMLDGSYGSRTALDAQYLADVRDYVATAISYAATNGVNIKAFEVGNEFWLGGQMTAYEYGLVAGTVAQMLDGEIAGTSGSDAEIIVQSTSAASVLYSPRNDATGYVGMENGAWIALSTRDINQNYGGVVPDGFQAITVPGQGGARNQVADIALGINATSGAGNAIDGLVQHYYQTQGFSGVDTGQAFKFEMFGELEGLLNRSDPEPLSYHITEWNTRSFGADNNRGLQNASMMVEIFFEFLTNGIDTAQIWPLSFNAAQGLSLVDLDGDDLSISGEMFGLMSESLIDLAPALDWSISGQIDIHGFSSSTRDVLFVSERSGARQEDVTLNAGAFLQDGLTYFLASTQLWDGGAGGANASAEPVITETDGVMATGTSLTFDLDSWANHRIEITYVGEGDDMVTGRGGADRIETFGGDDTIDGGAGNDTIDGDGGDDDINGGDGDDIILDGSGNDTIDGGAGFDTLQFEGASASYVIVYDATAAQTGDLHVMNAAGDIDLLSNIEHLQFSDGAISVADVEAHLISNYADFADQPEGHYEVSAADILFPPVSNSKMEVNSVQIRQLDSSYWQTVTFSETIDDAIVVMGPASHHGSAPLSVRVRNVTDQGFEFQIDEWEYQDGNRHLLDISWMAGTEGAHVLEDGSSVYFGSAATTSVETQSITFGGDAFAAPVVFGTLSGDAETTALTHRFETVTSDGFDWLVQVEEARRDTVTSVQDTSLNWVALDVAADSFIFDEASSSTNHRMRATDFTLDAGHAFFADMQSFAGPDTATLRYRQFEDKSISLRVQEEQSLDQERRHAEEDIALLALEVGIYDFV